MGHLTKDVREISNPNKIAYTLSLGWFYRFLETAIGVVPLRLTLANELEYQMIVNDGGAFLNDVTLLGDNDFLNHPACEHRDGG